MENKKVIIIPGAFQYVKNYGNYEGVDIWLKEKTDNEKIRNADFIIAHSFGANYVFSFPVSNNQKFILINPSIKKRNFVKLIIRDLKYLIFEKISLKKIIPIPSWFYAFKKVYKLSKIDTLKVIKQLPKENIFIIRGDKDNFFCDDEIVNIIKKENLPLIEVEAGHNWNKNIAKVVNKIIFEQQA